jgi:hypothetical protein
VTALSSALADRADVGVLARNPAWPVTALLVGYPLWWALGIADFSWVIFAVPMALTMLAWWTHRTRVIKVPDGFGMWLLFLICAVAGASVLGLGAPQTVATPLSHRVLAYLYRTGTYVGLTVLLLYVGNLTESELPRRRLAWMLGLVALYATLGGIAGMLWPSAQFKSPLYLLLPHSVQRNPLVQSATHPGLAQIQDVLGGNRARPKAPFDYTNTWGNCITILMPWLLVAWWRFGSTLERVIAASALLIAWVPLVHSLNRAAWAGAALSVGWLALWLVIKRRFVLLAAFAVGLAAVGIAIHITTLQRTIGARTGQHQKSNTIRSNLASLTLKDALSSPVIGYGDTRKMRGGTRSISVGPTAACVQCGQQEVGGTGQLWLVLITTGFLGAALYVGFFGFGIWRYRRDRTPYGLAGLLVLALSLLYGLTYGAIGAPLGFTILAYALLWRSDTQCRRRPKRGLAALLGPRARGGHGEPTLAGSPARKRAN